MLSIRSKRKVPDSKKHSGECSDFDGLPNREQLIDGSFELIDLLYQYISKDGVGLTYVQSSITAGKARKDLFNEFTLYFESIETTISDLTSITMQLHDVIRFEMDSYDDYCSITEKCHSNYGEMTASLKRMQTLLHESESFTCSSSPEMQKFISQMKTEVALLEAKQTDTRNVVVQIFTEYQKKVHLVTSSMDHLLIQMKEEIASLKQKDDFQSDFSVAKKKNQDGLDLLGRREHDNMIMLNDLISFLVQLKSILTCLKEECSSL